MTKYNRICIVCPTRGRAADKLPRFIRTAARSASSKDAICFSFVVNDSDEDSRRCIVERCTSLGVEYEIIPESLDRFNLAKLFNMSYEQTRFNSPETLVSMFGDDMVFRTPFWDKLIIDKMNASFGIGIVYGDDDYAQHENLCVYFVTSRLFVGMTGQKFMCEDFPVDWIDNVWMDVASTLRCAWYLPNLHILHDHCGRSGGPDETWARMRETAKEAYSKSTELQDIVSKRVAAVKAALEEMVSREFAVVMTTRDRVGVLANTVSSYRKSIIAPQRIDVFDDDSTDIASVADCVSKIDNAELHNSANHLGCDANNIRAIRLALDNTSADAVMVLDSDTAFAPTWFIAASNLWEKIKDDDRYAGATLFDAPQHQKNGDGDKATVGGFGSIYKRSVLVGALFEERKPGVPWDISINRYAQSRGMVFACHDNSFLQHTGYVYGMHVSDGEMSDYARNYVGELETAIVRRETPVAGQVLFVAMARLGDVVMASMIANAIMDHGIRVKWVTIPIYADLVRAISPRASVTTREPMVGGPEGEWSEMVTSDMRAEYPGYEAYVNAQVGARENHHEYTTSGMHPLDWLRERCECLLGISLDKNYRSHLEFAPNGDLAPREIPDNLAIVAPQAKTSQVITLAMVHDIVDRLKADGYQPRILLKDRPDHVPIVKLRQTYYCRRTVMSCIDIIRHAKHFVGNDSGMAWCSLFSDCTKEIYHSERRIAMVNTRFSKIDPNAKDIVVKEASK